MESWSRFNTFSELKVVEKSKDRNSSYTITVSDGSIRIIKYKLLYWHTILWHVCVSAYSFEGLALIVENLLSIFSAFKLLKNFKEKKSPKNFETLQFRLPVHLIRIKQFKNYFGQVLARWNIFLKRDQKSENWSRDGKTSFTSLLIIRDPGNRGYGVFRTFPNKNWLCRL